MIELIMSTQPDDETCGPTSIHAIYRHYGDPITLNEVLNSVDRLKTGGTLAALLGKHALERGYQAELYTYDLNVFDPTWFHEKKWLSKENLIDKLTKQLKFKQALRILETTRAYIEFLELGGTVRFKDLTVALLNNYFDKKIPVITGLSATYLYNCMREYPQTGGKTVYDDMIGEPSGHFVVLCGYDEHKRRIVVADPHHANPISNNNYYRVSSTRLLNAIMLGVITYDANLLIITPTGFNNANLISH